MPQSVEIVRNLRIPTAQGVSLAADLYCLDADARRPTLVCALPYLKDGVAGSSNAFFLERFAREGFNVLLVDMLGCGSAGGVAREPWDSGDAGDFLSAIGWAKQQSWCDGRFGIWGASYGAIMGLRAAALRPRGLRAVVAIECATHASNDFLNPLGIRGGFQPAGLWPTGDLAMQLLPPLHRDGDNGWAHVWRQRLAQARPRLFDYLKRPAADPFWNEHAVPVESVEAPTLVVAGWRDFLCRPSFEVYARLRAPKKLIAGPWNHGMPDQSPIAPIDLTSISIRWWRRWLLDEPNAIEQEPPVTAYVEGRNAWHALEAWPPRGSSLRWSPPDFAPVAKPVDPCVGFRDHLWGFPLPGLPHDASGDDRASLSFTGAPLDQATIIAGAPRLRLSIGATSEGVSWVAAKLSMVDADGVSRTVTHGAARCGVAGPVEMALTETCIEIPRGQRLRVSIAAADFPRFWPQADAKVLALDAAPQLELPVIRLDEKSRAGLPQHDPSTMLVPLAIGLLPEWSVSEDLVTQSVTLTLGMVGSMHTPQREATLELGTRVSTTVSRLMPGAASVTGTTLAVARWQNRPEIRVEGRLQVTASTAEAHATIHEGSAKVFERSWKLDGIP